VPDNLRMKQASGKQDDRSTVFVDFQKLCWSVKDLQPPPPDSFVALVAMRESAPFASHDLAMQLSRNFGLARSIEASYSAMEFRNTDRPVSSRDVVDYWGYRVTHSTSVVTALIEYLGEGVVLGTNQQFWLRAVVIASFAGVLGDVLELHSDQAFSASLLRSTALFFLQEHVPAEAQAARDFAESTRTLLWDAETELMGGSHLDLGRSLCEHWGLSSQLLPAFHPADQPDSLSGLILRATAAAERLGFQDQDGAIVPLHLRPEREPVVDAYFRNGGGTPASYIEEISGILGLTSLLDFDSAA
jgi:HD-like signal output (HDOD) protein